MGWGEEGDWGRGGEGRRGEEWWGGDGAGP